MKRSNAFTLIELLVVIAVIAVLMGILMPALSRARDQAKKTVCISQSKQLGMCMRLYAEDNDGYLHSGANNGLWDNAWEDPVVVKEYDWDDSYAYWGLAYKRYANSKKIFHCPSQERVDDWPESGWGYKYQGFFKYCGYGLNKYVNWSYKYNSSSDSFVDNDRSCNLYRDFKRKDEVILFQDHIEQKLDDNGDMFYIKSGSSINLTQWRNGGTLDDFPDAVDECFRHAGRSVTTWGDGHVSEIRKTTGEDVERHWYTGKRVASSTKSVGRGS